MNSNFENELPEYNFEEHWNKAYQKTPTTNLGWYEENPMPSLELIEACNLSNDAVIFNAGAGATSLINRLLEKGYKNIIIKDSSFNNANSLNNLENWIQNIIKKSTIIFNLIKRTKHLAFSLLSISSNLIPRSVSKIKLRPVSVLLMAAKANCLVPPWNSVY